MYYLHNILVSRWKQIGIVWGLRRCWRQWSGGSVRRDQSSARVDARGSRSPRHVPRAAQRAPRRLTCPRRPPLQQRPQLNSFARLADFEMPHAALSALGARKIMLKGSLSSLNRLWCTNDQRLMVVNRLKRNIAALLFCTSCCFVFLPYWKD